MTANTARATRIIDVIAGAFDMSRDQLVFAGRHAAIAHPRQLAMYLVRSQEAQGGGAALSLPAIGRLFGGRHHTTVLSACRATWARLGPDVCHALVELTELVP